MTLQNLIMQKYNIDIEDAKFMIYRKYRMFMDKITIYSIQRWFFIFLLLIVYILRIYTTRAYAMVTYGLAVYYLKNILLYITPQDDYL